MQISEGSILGEKKPKKWVFIPIDISNKKPSRWKRPGFWLLQYCTPLYKGLQTCKRPFAQI